MSGEQRRRRDRRRASAPAGPPRPERPEPAGDPVAAPPPVRPPVGDQRPARPPRRDHQGLGDLVGSGHSQLGVSGALRARDVNRPTEQDLAEAERDVVLVRRNWKPPPT